VITSLKEKGNPGWFFRRPLLVRKTSLGLGIGGTGKLGERERRPKIYCEEHQFHNEFLKFEQFA
jgi:hypothetical protein